jgi:hypothetical protein
LPTSRVILVTLPSSRAHFGFARRSNCREHVSPCQRTAACTRPGAAGPLGVGVRPPCPVAARQRADEGLHLANAMSTARRSEPYAIAPTRPGPPARQSGRVSR